jgi:hypothetical protein
MASSRSGPTNRAAVVEHLLQEGAARLLEVDHDHVRIEPGEALQETGRFPRYHHAVHPRRAQTHLKAGGAGRAPVDHGDGKLALRHPVRFAPCSTAESGEVRAPKAR